MGDASQSPGCVLLNGRASLCADFGITFDEINLKQLLVQPKTTGSGTYVRMSPNLFNSIIVKMTGIAQKASSNIVGMLEPVEDAGRKGKLVTFPELCPHILALYMEVLHPAVVSCSLLMADMLLEDNDI